MCTLDKSHARLMTFLNTLKINSMLYYDKLDIGMLDITASPIIVVYYNLYDIHEKFEYSCDVTNKAHPHPLLACLLCLKGPTFLY